MARQPSVEEQLRDVIRGSGISLTQLGQITGVDSGRLSRFMRGERDLTLAATAKLCEVLRLKLAPDDQPGGSDRADAEPLQAEEPRVKPKPRASPRPPKRK